MHQLTYLAIPYSHRLEEIREGRFLSVNAWAAKLMLEGEHIFSPISHTHPIAQAGELPKGWDFWRKYDEVMLRCCTKLKVLMLPGWRESVGVTGEIEIATGMGIPIEYIEP